MASFYTIFFAAIVGALVGAIIWTIFFAGVGGLLSIGGGINISPVFSISDPFKLGVWLGIIVGTIHGLFTGLAIGVFNLSDLRGALAGFLVIQICLVAVFLLTSNGLLEKGPADSSIFDTIIGNLLSIIIGWAMLSALFFIQSAATGYVSAKILSRIVLRLNSNP